MGKIDRQKTLRSTLLRILTLCFVVMLLGMRGISWLTERVADIYTNMYPYVDVVILRTGEVEWLSGGSAVVKWLIVNAEYLLIPLWVMLCVTVAGLIFYNRELRAPIDTLMTASKKIADNDLDFRIVCEKKDEIGRLCEAFEDMRGKLFTSNMEIWQTMEERRRLSAAFSHDLRTPLTVLSGYVELMQSCGDRITPEKQAEILAKMQSQVERLRSYTEQMNAVQKLEDITPAPQEISMPELCAQLKDTGTIICGDKAFGLNAPAGERRVLADSALILRVCENLSANASRYAATKVTAEVTYADGLLSLCFADDGEGFSEEALQKADRPFYRGDRDSNTHFGLGLYICRLLCMKCGGGLRIENGAEGGGKVTAIFRAPEV